MCPRPGWTRKSTDAPGDSVRCPIFAPPFCPLGGCHGHYSHRALPELAQSAIKPNGDIDVRTIVRGVVRNPLSLKALVSTGIDFNLALRSLRGCRGFLMGHEDLVAANA